MAAEVRRVMALGQLTSLPSDLDNLVIVDVDDTTQAASGSTKRITVADLLGDAQKISNHAATSVIGRSVDSVGVAADIVAGANGVLRRAGTGALSFSTLVTGNIGDSAVTNAKLAQMAAQTVKGRAADTGTPQDIVAGYNGVLRRSGTGNLEFGTLVAGNIASDAITTDKILNANVTDAKLASNAVTTVKILDANVTNAKLANMVQATIKGRESGAGTGVPVDLTAAQARTILNVEDGANAYVHPNHTGDVTSAGGGATTIASNVVTNEKLSDMTANLIKGRISTTGDPQDLTATQVRTILNVADGANNYTHPNHSGDVTSAGGGATTIASNVVTNEKLSDMVQATIKGRASGAGTGDPVDLTAAQARTILNVEDGANAYVHPNHTGDVTSSGGGATTIANNAVTNAKLADMVTARIKGRVTAGTGDPEDLTYAQVLAAILPMNRQGGSPTSFSSGGTTNYTPSNLRVQFGAIPITVASGSGSVTITFPVAFSNTPVIFALATGALAGDILSIVSVFAGTSQIAAVGSSNGTGTLHWLAIGPA